MREVVQAIRHEPDLAPGVRGDAHHVGRGGHDELDRLGIGLDPVLLVRGDVHEEYRVEARRGLVELGLELAQPGRGFPMYLLARIAAPVLAHAAEAQRIGKQAPAHRELGERAQRRQLAVAHRQRRRVGDDLRRDLVRPLRHGEPEPVAAAQPDRTDRVGAALRHDEREAQHEALMAARREARVDPPAREAGRWLGRLDTLRQEQPQVEPRQR